MSDRTKLMMICVAAMMLPYRIDFAVVFLLLTARVCAGLDAAIESWGTKQVSPNALVFLSLYQRLKYRPASDYQAATR